MLVYEASMKRDPVLRDIDLCFVRIQKNMNDKVAKRELRKHIITFTGMKDVRISIKKDWDNASVFTVYKNTFPKFSATLTDKNFDRFEFAKHVTTAYIFFGSRFIEKNHYRELTAVLLHELGHIYQHTHNLHGVPRLARRAIDLSSLFLSFAAVLPITLTLMMISRSLTFLEHMGENDADEFASEHGYADEMIRVLNRYHKLEIAENSGFFDKVVNIINEIFFPSSHPSHSKRICRIANQMQKKYKDMYPRMNNELRTILTDLKC